MFLSEADKFRIIAMLWKKEEQLYYDLHCRGGSFSVLIIIQTENLFCPCLLFVRYISTIEDMQQQNNCPFKLYSIVCIVCLFVY